MTSRRSSPDGPEDVDAAFAEIVAVLAKEGLGIDLPDEPDPSEFDPPTAPIEQTAPTNPTSANSGWRTADTEWDWAYASDDEHYVPPEPPPLPRLRAGTIFGLMLLVIGLLLLIAPKVIGLDMRIATPLALIAVAGGIGWLVVRMRQGPPPDAGSDDGAQV